MKNFAAMIAFLIAGTSLATVHTVNVLALSFSPSAVTVQAGDTVRWIKPAGGFHNVAATSNPPLFRSGEPTSSAFTYNFQFTEQHAGTHPYVCEVHAPGMAGTVTVEGGGSPPGTPSNPNPADGATGVPTTAELSWAAAPDADFYVVRLGTSNPPPVVNPFVEATMYDPGVLEPATEYFWQLTAMNGFGQTNGPVWSFMTVTPPGAATNPFPADDATNVPVTTFLGWDAADGATNYEVYLGTSEPLGLLGETAETTLNPPGDLMDNALYLWRVTAVNAVGSTPSETWSFQTEAGSAAGDELLPGAFQLGQAYPNPFNGAVRISLRIAQDVRTVARIFDLTGRDVTTLVDGRLSAGEHLLEWNAGGHAAGLYFLRCECAGLTQTQKLIYLP